MNPAELPEAPPAGRVDLQTVAPAGPYWRLWHPTRRTSAANAPRHYGPLYRFDPHLDGERRFHEDVFVLYASLTFEVSALEVFHRGVTAVDVCPNWRGTLVSAPSRSRLFDLTDEETAQVVGATPRSGDTDLDQFGYGTTQGWARFFRASPGVHGLRYLSCRSSDR